MNLSSRSPPACSHAPIGFPYTPLAAPLFLPLSRSVSPSISSASPTPCSLQKNISSTANPNYPKDGLMRLINKKKLVLCLLLF